MSEPINKTLYNRVKSETKKKFKVYPSAYANAWLVREYKRRGGTYRVKKSPKRSKSRRKSPKRSKSRRKSPKRSKSRRKSPKRSKKSGLNRWFDEKWINVCKLPKIVKCGRSKSSNKNYPYCRPLRRVNKSTPRTVREIPKSRLKKLCKEKRKSPKKKVNVRKSKKKSRKNRS